MAGSTRSASDSTVLPSVGHFSPIQHFLRRNFSFKGDFIGSKQQSDHFRPARLIRFIIPSKTAPSAMETVTPMSPISPSAGVTAADAIGARQRRLSFVPKTPSQLSRSSLPISPPVTPDKQNFFDPGIKSTTPEDDDVFQSLPQVAAATQRLSFVASSQGKGRKA
ncbi:hypothetical protein CALVIDRAFT_533412 [Calocera viscosa TUFC12733]|uniref:Uncharacterized protein n=1 Tax=Calocera viscosa (strain TUFC12733) TaxID=1330018 RepID=A0A167QZC7_CALVF|nr:hypothetical protein CALVIDRAFT_533412 [Calocera viscosa TUFC12733]